MNGLYLMHFLLGLIASFAGTLPFGTINLSVVSTTVNQGFRAGLVLSIAAAIVEIFQSLIAFYCSVWITENIERNIYLKVGLVFFFMSIGIYFLVRSSADSRASTNRFRLHNFVRGILLGIFNPQALPFWVFVIAYFQAARLIQLDAMHIQPGLLASFLLGVSIGKLGALVLCGVMSIMVMRKIRSIGSMMNKILAGLFIFLALAEGLRIIGFDH